MSAAGRGPRLGGPDDYYATPEWCTHALLKATSFGPMGRFIEPCAGGGAIIKAFKSFKDGWGEHRYASESYPWEAVEIRDEERAALEATADRVVITDFLDIKAVEGPVIAFISNPPYNRAAEIIQHCRKLRPDVPVCMLLRLNYLGSQKRAAWLRDWVPDVYVLSKRPSFKNGATDATEYAWFSWPDGKPRKSGTIQILELPA